MREFKKWLEKDCCEECICHLDEDYAKDVCNTCIEERSRVWKAALEWALQQETEDEIKSIYD